MPYGDGTGPNGRGPRGRGMGPCRWDAPIGYNSYSYYPRGNWNLFGRFFGRFFDRGGYGQIYGRGYGRGYGNMQRGGYGRKGRRGGW